MQKILHSAVLTLLVAVLGLELYLLAGRILQLEELLLSLFLAVAGVSALFFRSERGVSIVLGAFLVSFSTALSGLSWGELRILLPGLPGRVADFLWTGLLCAMPFLFVHLAMIFPVRQHFLRNRSRLFFLFYAFPITLAVVGQFDPLIWLIDPFVLLFPLGFLVGTAIFARQYFLHLTRAEKQRLRLVLIGCLAGIIPRLLFLLAREQLPVEANRFSLLLLPLFPLCLLLATQPLSPGEWDPRLQRVFGWGVGGAVWIAAGFLFFVLGTLLLPALPNGLLLASSILVGLLFVWPLGRRALSYLSEEVDWSGRKGQVSLPFSPIRPNPFVVGNPVRDPEMFFGRRAEFHFIQQTLRGQPEGAVIVLCGERRTGKTSILWQLLEGRLGDPFHPIFLDMQGMVARGDEAFFRQLLHECRRTLTGADSNEEAKETTTPDLELRDLLANVVQERPDKRLLILIDEYELIEERMTTGRLKADFPRYLNSLLERIRGLSFVFTGSQPLEERTHWNDLLGKSFYREISFLDPEDARALLQVPLEQRAVFEESALSRLLRLSAGHPYFTQLLGQNLVDTINENRNPVVRQDTVEKVIERVLEHPPPHLIYQWGERSIEEKLVLAALASLLSSPAQFVPWKRIPRLLASVAHEQARSLNETRIRILLEKLRRARLVDRDQERYRFRMDLLRCWLKAEETIWSVLG